jgi:hypothetical protein
MGENFYAGLNLKEALFVSLGIETKTSGPCIGGQGLGVAVTKDVVGFEGFACEDFLRTHQEGPSPFKSVLSFVRLEFRRHFVYHFSF